MQLRSSVRILALAVLAGWLPLAAAAAAPVSLPAQALSAADSTAERVDVPIDWAGYRRHAELLGTPDGPRYRVVRTDGSAESLTPDAFAARAIEVDRGRAPIERALNVTGWVGIAWVTFGLLGQVIFMGRMVVQWLASEKKKQSIVPPTFWFMSLVGSVMLLIYFVWRWDIVGVLGQSLGSVIYVRNIMLIRSHARRSSALDAEARPA